MWLLLFALPVQGYAVATMVNCAPSHQHHQHTSTAPHHHEAAAADDDDGVASSMNHIDKVAKFKCSACAACCVGAALPTSVFAIAAVKPAVTPAFFVASPHVDFLSDGLDRPPRPFFV